MTMLKATSSLFEPGLNMVKRVLSEPELAVRGQSETLGLHQDFYRLVAQQVVDVELRNEDLCLLIDVLWVTSNK